MELLYIQQVSTWNGATYADYSNACIIAPKQQ